MKKANALGAPSSLPLAAGPALVAPNALACLRCQLLGRRKLMCSRADACKEIPHVFALGPILLAGWIATILAFVLAIA
jgi:hypothetical protein